MRVAVPNDIRHSDFDENKRGWTHASRFVSSDRTTHMRTRVILGGCGSSVFCSVAKDERDH